MSFSNTFPYSLDDFKIVKEIGGDKVRKINRVFQVAHKVSGLNGVLKHHQKKSGQDHLAELIRNEAEWSFQQVGLPETLAFEETENEILLIKSFAPGIPLSAYFATIPKGDREAFILRFLEAFLPISQTLISEGIVHADIKPTNFIVDGSGLDFKLSLIDFGLAFRYDAAPKRKVIFSLGYAAPELILNQLDLARHATDLYALGICLYQLWEGKLPLTHANPGIMTNLQLTHPLPEPARSAMIKHIISRCCAKAAFPKPPNLLELPVCREILTRGIEMRCSSVELLLSELQHLPLKSGWKERLVKIFTKS